MANRKLEFGDVLHLNHEVLSNGAYAGYFSSYPFLLKYKTWVVAKVNAKVEDGTVVRLRPLAKSRIAMTVELCLESIHDEYTYDAFLTAAHKATRK